VIQALKHLFHRLLYVPEIDTNTNLIQLFASYINFDDPVVSMCAGTVSRITFKGMSCRKMGLDVHFINAGHGDSILKEKRDFHP
jgi:hypothetical protein